MRGRKAIAKGLGGLGLGALGLLAAILASQWLGGPVAMVTVKGASMEPGLHAGDLVIVRSSNDYQVGEAVAYRSEQLNALVLHRIEERSGEVFTLKGDNNDWLDPEQPTQDQLVGKQWIHIPAAGKALGLIGNPFFIIAAGLGAAASLLRRRRKPGRAGKRSVTAGHSSPTRSTQIPPWVPAAVGTVAIIGLLGFLFLRPSSSDAPQVTTGQTSYSHEGTFSYEADTAVSPAYQDGSVTTGEPVFLRLIDELDVGFAYTLEAEGAGSIEGTGMLTAQLSDGSGWTYDFDLGKERPIEGRETMIRGVLDLDRIEAVIKDVQKLTRASGPVYTLKIIPKVHVMGAIAGRQLDDSFSPGLPFQFEGSRMRLADNSDPAGGGEDLLNPTQGHEGEGSSAAGASSSPSALARYKLPLLIVIATLIAMAVGVFLSRRDEGDEEGIARRHDIAVVPVAALPVLQTAVNTVDVTSMESLALLASQLGKAILRLEGSGKPTFVTIDDGCVYRYRPNSRSKPSPRTHAMVAPPPPPPPAVEADTNNSLWGV